MFSLNASVPSQTSLNSHATQNIENTVVDEANHRTYVVMAPRVLLDGEIYKAIRQEILKRGGVPPPPAKRSPISLTCSQST